MPAMVEYTLHGGPHNKLKVKFTEGYLSPAFRLLHKMDNGVHAPDAVYILKEIQQKNRTIKRYEYYGDIEDWDRERENRNRLARARRLERLRRQILHSLA